MTGQPTHVRLTGWRESWIAFVAIPGEPEVKVRFARSRWPQTYTCAIHGPMRLPWCDHARAAWHTERLEIIKRKEAAK